MDSDIQNARTILFSNLLLLGFQPDELQKLHKIPFNKNMFDVPNKKAFEVVTYFLFCKLPDARVEFRKCWPISDKKSELQFRKTTSQFITRIMNDSVRFPQYTQSMLLSPGGNRFVQVYLAITRYIMLQQLKNYCKLDLQTDILRRPSPCRDDLRSSCANSLSVATNMCIKDFLNSVRRQSSKHNEWSSVARRLKSTYWKLQENIDRLNDDIKSTLENYASMSVLKDGSFKAVMAEHLKKVNEVRSIWKFIDTYQSNVADGKEVMSDILVPDSARMVLDAKDVKIELDAKDSIPNLYTDDKKLIFNSVLMALKFHLEFFQTFFTSVKIPNFNDSAEKFSLQLSEYQANRKILTDVIFELKEEMIPEIGESLDELRPDLVPVDYELHEQILPPTPTRSFAATDKHIRGTTPVSKNLISPVSCLERLFVGRRRSTNVSELSNDESVPHDADYRNGPCGVNAAEDSTAVERLSFTNDVDNDYVESADSKAKAQSLLARQIVDDVMNGDQERKAAVDAFIGSPLSALGPGAFVTKDKLVRTPSDSRETGSVFRDAIDDQPTELLIKTSSARRELNSFDFGRSSIDHESIDSDSLRLIDDEKLPSLDSSSEIRSTGCGDSSVDHDDTIDLRQNTSPGTSKFVRSEDRAFDGSERSGDSRASVDDGDSISNLLNRFTEIRERVKSFQIDSIGDGSMSDQSSPVQPQPINRFIFDPSIFDTPN